MRPPFRMKCPLEPPALVWSCLGLHCGGLHTEEFWGVSEHPSWAVVYTPVLFSQEKWQSWDIYLAALLTPFFLLLIVVRNTCLDYTHIWSRLYSDYDSATLLSIVTPSAAFLVNTASSPLCAQEHLCNELLSTIFLQQRQQNIHFSEVLLILIRAHILPWKVEGTRACNCSGCIFCKQYNLKLRHFNWNLGPAWAPVRCQCVSESPRRKIHLQRHISVHKHEKGAHRVIFWCSTQ